VSSNEPINGPGDGNTAPDWVITGTSTVDLRSERSGTGTGRVYIVKVECTDSSGNSATKRCLSRSPRAKANRSPGARRGSPGVPIRTPRDENRRDHRFHDDQASIRSC
jgi:hypothetical protein